MCSLHTITVKIYGKGVIFEKEKAHVIPLEIRREQNANFITKHDSLKYTKVK